ncbi:trypsin [Eurosta solidaginis]|uniref:trypsin n=1 Tax=Eurosta solidaginis TaxID=178769 RepID=UPI00353150B5
MQTTFLWFVLVASILAAPSFSLSKNLAVLNSVKPENRIIGGEEVTTPSVAPYLVSLSVSSIVYAHACAGVIIGKEWVLTAAHCLEELKNSNRYVIGLPVYAGIQDRSIVENAQISKIDFAFSHNQFNISDESSPDIALVHVSPAFIFNFEVNSVVLPYRNEDYSNKSTTSYGWGLTVPEGQEFVKKLQLINTQVLTENKCRMSLPDDAPLGNNQICAVASACFGDGGSPLVYETRRGAELIGITSWGYLPCGYNKRPTVYTEVSKYIGWIAEVQWAYYILN